MRRRYLRLAMAAAAVLYMGASALAAQGVGVSTSSPTAKQTKAPASPIVDTGLKYVKTILAIDDSVNTTPPSGFSALDAAHTFTCPSTPGTCTLEVRQNGQIWTGSNGTNWALCTQLDGNFLSEPNCPYLGSNPGPPGNEYVSGTFEQAASHLAAGSHTIQTFIYVGAADTVIVRYLLAYQIYKP